MIFTVDREGWGDVFECKEDVEGSLEGIDVLSGEYRIIDEHGTVYTWHENPDGFYRYRIAATNSQDIALLARVQTARRESNPDDYFRVEMDEGS